MKSLIGMCQKAWGVGKVVGKNASEEGIWDGDGDGGKDGKFRTGGRNVAAAARKRAQIAF